MKNRFKLFTLAVMLTGFTSAYGQAISSTANETANVEVSTSTNSNLEANNGSIGMSDNGSYVVAFQQKESSASANSTDIIFGVSTLGSGYSEVGIVNSNRSYIQMKPVVGTSSDGTTFAIAWLSQTGSTATTYDVYVKVYGAIDGPTYTGTSDIKVNSTAVATDQKMDMAMDENGDFVVVWSDLTNDKIYAQRFNSSGTKQGGIISVDDVYGFAVYNLYVAMDASGEFVVTWYDARTEDASGGVFAKKFNADGTVQNSTFLVNHITTGYQNGGQVDMASSGEFVIAYFDGTDAYYRKYEANGSLIGTYNTFSISGFTSPSIRGFGIDDNLNYTVAFSESGEGIYAQRYEWNGTAIGTATTIATGADRGDISISRSYTQYAGFVAINQFTSSPVQYKIYAYRHGLCLADPGSISGETAVCPGQSSVSYSLSAVSGASGYNWTLSNASIATFSNSTASISTTLPSVTVNYDGINTGTVTLTVEADGGSSCGTSLNTSDLSVTSSNISNPGSISGSTTVVENTLKQYSISAISGAVSYNWTLPTGATVDTDNGNSIIVQFGTTSGTIAVTATDECGNETSSSSISVSVVATDDTPPEAITLTPANGSDGVALTTGVYNIRFDETVTLVPGLTVSLKSGTGKSSTTIATASSSTSITGGGKSGWSIDFGHGSLTAGTSYFIEIPANMFHDSQNNYFAGTSSSSWSFTANRAPTDIAISNSAVTDGDPASTVVGTFSATDADSHESFTYDLITGTGDDDNSLFTISGASLLTNHAVDYETQTSYSILVQVTDGAGATYSEVMTISVTDVDDSGPVQVSNSPEADATGVDLGTSITITFDENIQFRDDITTNIRLKRGTTVEKFWMNDPVNEIYPTDATISGSTITLDIGSDLYFNSTYTLEAFSIADNLGNTNYSDEFSFTTRPASFENDILTFSLPGMIGDATIDPVNHTVTATMGATASNVAVPTATISEGATSSLTSGSPITFVKNGTKSVSVSAESGTYQSWQITLTWKSLSGDYTIGGSGDFASLTSFLSSLGIQGASSDLTASIEDGYTYDGQINLPSYNGNDTYSVTIKPQSGASNISFTNTGGSYIVDFYTSKGFVIDGADPVSGDRVFTFKSVEDVTTAAIYLTYSGNGQVKNSIIESTQYGIYSYPSASATQTGYHFTNNEIIFKHSQNTATVAGIYLRWSKVDDCSATGNLIRMDASAPDAQSILGIYSYGSLTIDNNVVIARSDNFYGIRVDVNTYPSEIRHNTVVLHGSEEGTGTPGALYGVYTKKTSSSIALDVQNNVIHLDRGYTSSSWIKNALYYYSGYANSTVDYNNLWVNDDGVSEAHLVKNGGAGYLDDIASLSSLMPNTTGAQPVFSDLSNGNATFSGESLSDPELRSTSFYLSTDIEGNTRSTNAPLKGAYETDNNITDIISFSIPNQKGEVVIDAENHTVTAAIDENGDITSVAPAISIFAGASIAPNSGVTQDFTSDVTYTVTAEAGNTQDWVVSISSNSAPTDITLSVSSLDENNAVSDVIGSFSSTDADASDSHTYSLVAGTGDTDNASFTIDGDNLKAAAVFNYELKSSYSIRVQTDDGNGGTFEKQFIISINNVSEVPLDLSLSVSGIFENQPSATIIGTLTTMDEDAGETYSYSLVTGIDSDDNAFFSIAGDVLKSAATFDYETKNSYSILIQTDDNNGGTLEKQFTITVVNKSEAPTNINLSASSIEENNSINDIIGSLSSVDEDAGETYTYSLVTGTGDTDNASFNIDGSNLRASERFDFETKSSYSVRVQTDDGNGGTFEKQFTISINDVPEVPLDLSLSVSGIFENQPSATIIGTLTTMDEDAGETYSYSLVTGIGSDDNASFSIAGDVLKSAATFDYETKNSYSILIQTDDNNGGTLEKQFTIMVVNKSEAPTNINLSATSIEENNSVNDIIGSLSSVDEDAGETYTYTLAAGSGDTDNASFNIDGSNLRASESFDFETKSSYSVRVQTNDGNGGIYSKSFTITISDVINEMVVWNGTVWNNGSGPSATDDVEIVGDYTGGFICNNLVVNSGINLTVDAGNYLDVHGDLTNNGSVEIASEATLLTYDGNSISDNITIKRNTRYADGKYSFVGTPVESDASITGSMLGNPVYTYDESVAYGANDGLNRWKDASTTILSPGQGYAQAFQQEISFTGRPNDGTILAGTSFTSDVDNAYEGWNLVSNPYPAAIDVSEFISANTNIEGAIYLWDDNDSQTGRGGNSDYIVVNGMTFTQSSQAGNQNRYNQHLGSMQGFFVKLTGSGSTSNVTFSEDMRVTDSNGDDHFFRTESEKQIIRINLKNSDGLFKQAVIGMMNGLDDTQLNRIYDAPVFNPYAGDLIYTIKQNQPLAIQGVSPQVSEVPIVLNISETGMYELEFDMEAYHGTNLYLYDRLKDKTIDITNASYSFTTGAGQVADRFVLKTAANILSAANLKSEVYAYDRMVRIKQPGTNPATYRLLNLSGVELTRVVVEGTAQIDLSNYPAGVYLVQGDRTTHKIILK